MQSLSTPISLVAIESLSALGSGEEQVWSSYLSGKHALEKRNYNGVGATVAPLSEGIRKKLGELRELESRYRQLDDTVLFAMYVARLAIKSASWTGEKAIGINIGSSRGATGLFESRHKEFISTGRTTPATSPTTTLGNISSWIAHDLKTTGPEISHSITCSTALHAVLNGIAWLQSGMTDRFLVGGSEAPLTPFTLAQMKALKIYSEGKDKYPCRALDLDKNANSMVLGEGAAVACLQKGVTPLSLAIIEGVGYATEILEHPVSISTEADCFQKSMAMALGDLAVSEVDAIVMHAPGTIQGDLSECRAVKKVFGNSLPLLTSNKWQTGHTFGASGMLSLELAVLMLRHQVFIPVPYSGEIPTAKKLQRILVNSVGFGGNAVSVLLRHPQL
ncbi:beta-ketoacyl synthase N-terminal-like domain-containing protein [Muriicola sp. E247]|uniref:beta-ketoacyl synthase N-terminal-like domain-containing protein n=1 Tax=Muriicola sp. E247 TaxID=3242730 RepID=UPI0035235FC6